MFENNDHLKVILLFSTMCAFLLCVVACTSVCVSDFKRGYPEAKSNPLEFSLEAGRLATAQDDIQWASKA